MKLEKILISIIALVILVSLIVYFTLPEQGERVYIPKASEELPAQIEIPEGYKKVDNFDDVYYIETDNGYRFFWLVEFQDGTYGWQEVDKDGNIIFPEDASDKTENSSDVTGSNITESSQPTESTVDSTSNTESNVPETVSE